MFDSQDIYRYLKNGGNKEDLHTNFKRKIAEAEKKIEAEKEAEKKEKELAEQEAKARAAAFKALKFYFALVNPDITEDIINSVLDTLESIEIKINGARDKIPTILYDIFKLI